MNTEALDRVTMETTAPEGVTTKTEAPDCVTMETAAPEGVTTKTEAPDCVTTETATPDGVIMKSEAPDRVTMETAAPDRVTMEAAAPEGVTMEASAPDRVSTKSAAPESVTMKSETPHRVTMETATPAGVTMETEALDRVTMETTAPASVTMKTAAPDSVTVEAAAPDRVTVSRSRKRKSGQTKKRGLSRPKKVRNKRGTMTSIPASLQSQAAQTQAAQSGTTSRARTTSSLARLLSWYRPEPSNDVQLRPDDVINTDCDVTSSRDENDVFNPLQTPMDEVVDPAVFPIKDEMESDTALDGREPETIVHSENFTAETENQVVQVKEEPAELLNYDSAHLNEPTPNSERPRTSMKKTHSCDQCPRVFRKSYDLNIHKRRIHSGVKPFICDLCGQGFATGIERKKHLTLHEPTPDRQVKCDICFTYFKNGFALFRHKSQLHKIYDETLMKPGSHVCTVCREGFEREDTKMRHMKSRHPEEYAAFIASREDDVKEQKICSFCGESFKSAYQLKRHERSKHAKEKCSCTHCGKEFVSLSRLRSHERWSHVHEPVLCSMCGEECSSLAKLRRHERIKHREPEKHLCSYCGKNLSSEALLRVHERTHTGERPFSCDSCDKSFICKRRLWDHKKDTHEQRRRSRKAEPIACSVCGRTVRKDSLRAHLKTHENERNFKCPHCELRFKTLVCMRTHTSVHTGEKPHMCGVCGKSFRLRDYLKTHMELHADNREKTHKCPTCDNRYMFPGGVRTHQKLTGCGGKVPARKRTGNKIQGPKANKSSTLEDEVVDEPGESELVPGTEMSVDWLVDEGRLKNVFQFLSRGSDSRNDSGTTRADSSN